MANKPSPNWFLFLDYPDCCDRFSSSKHSDEKTSPDKPGPELNFQKHSPTKDVNVADRLSNINEDELHSSSYSDSGGKRKESGGYVSSGGTDRRQSKGDSSLYSRSTVDTVSSGYMSMRGVVDVRVAI